MTEGVVTDAGTPLCDYAVGPTPAYSLSKALLNAHTRLWHRQLVSEGISKSVRVMAVCPGNFQSPLSQPGIGLYGFCILLCLIMLALALASLCYTLQFSKY